MKKIILSISLAALILTACNNKTAKTETTDSTTMMGTDENMMEVSKPVVKSGQYVDLTTGKKIYIVANPETGIAMDSITKAAVEFYYNPITMDTIYQNGMVVNRMLINEGNGKYKLDGMKIKIDGDKIKIKTDSSKMKMNGTEMKMKTRDSTSTTKTKNY